VALTGLSMVLVAPVLDATSATASTTAPLPPPALTSLNGSRATPSELYSGYYENLVGAVTLQSTITVPTVKCTNHNTWGSQVGVLALMDSSSGQIEHGGGVEVGCGALGAPSYKAALCDPNNSGCAAVSNPVAPGDTVTVQVAASGGCSSTCTSVTVTMTDSTEAVPWTVTWTGESQSDFDTFVAVVGSPPVPDFGKVVLSGTTINSAGFGGERFNLVDHANRTLARASALKSAQTSFSVKWVASS
jgi:hypothetical protein